MLSGPASRRHRPSRTPPARGRPARIASRSTLCRRSARRALKNRGRFARYAAPKGNGPTDCPVPSCEGRRRGSDKLLPYQISTAVEGENPPPVVSGRLIHHPRTLHNTARLLADERAEVARQGHGGGGQAELRDRNADVSSLGGLLVLLPS